MTSRNMIVPSHVQSVVDNLRSTDPRLVPVSAWRIDFAHRQYSVSEDFGDDLKVFDWLPEDSDDALLTYVLHYHVGDIRRENRELSELITNLRRELRDANATIRRLQAEAGGGL